MYHCGPTVYDYLHLGNARNLVVFDVLRRVLATRYQVWGIRNITDVDDKILHRAHAEGVSWSVIAERYTQAYHEDAERLGVLPPDCEPKASDHVEAMVALIQRLVAAGRAYVVEGDVYYRVEGAPAYGKLSGRKLEELEAGARVEVDPRKAHPMDFALWKSAKGEPAWPSPWGTGRPGWHIECSAMAMAYGGETLDIHTGGSDLIFPHHENEIAQAEAVTGQPFVRYWLHNGMLAFQGGKMSKSVGNVLYLRDLLNAQPPMAVRYFLLSAHYRSTLEYSPAAVAASASAYEALVDTFARLKEWCGRTPTAGFHNPLSLEFVRSVRLKFWEALSWDLNTPEALAQLFQLARVVKQVMANPAFTLTQPTHLSFKSALNTLYEGLAVLGLAPAVGDVPEAVRLLIQKREEARKHKAFAEADLIRAQLLKQGIHVEDTPAGPIPIVKRG